MQYDENAEKYGYEGEMTPLKCDELKAYIAPTPDGTGLADYYLKTEADKVIAEKDAEIAELKQKLEDAKATAYAESVDAGMRERRLKRALWLARAISAANAAGEIHNVIVCMRERHLNMSLSNTEAQEQVWKEVSRKCRAKAEEYK